jgi:hypothetical protein
MDRVLLSEDATEGFVGVFVVAWSAVRRFNAG